MAVCNSCGHFCPDCEGKRYCMSCRDAYIRRLEEVEQVAKGVVYAMRAPPSEVGPDALFITFTQLSTCLKDMERHHGQPTKD